MSAEDLMSLFDDPSMMRSSLTVSPECRDSDLVGDSTSIASSSGKYQLQLVKLYHHIGQLIG